MARQPWDVEGSSVGQRFLEFQAERPDSERMMLATSVLFAFGLFVVGCLLAGGTIAQQDVEELFDIGITEYELPACPVMESMAAATDRTLSISRRSPLI